MLHQLSSREVRRPRLELGLIVLLFASTVLVAAYFAPRGSNAGFVDMGHDGYTLRQAQDLERGATLFKDTYEQYGTLGPYLNLASFELLGRRLLAIKYGICIWYGFIAVLLYRGARHFLDPALSAVAILTWLSLAPFYQHGIMISVHVYVLFAQAAATLALLSYLDRPKLGSLAIAGVFCGLSCILKQSVGFLFAVAVGTYFVSRIVRRRSTFRTAALEMMVFSVPAIAVIGAALTLLWAKGALGDWYLQTILFPRQFYLGTGDEYGGSLISFPMRFINAHIREHVAWYWYVIRGVLAIGLGAAVWKGSADRTEEKAVLVGVLSLVLWIAAYPSPHYMHQWWTLGVAFGMFVWCVRRVSQTLVAWFSRDLSLIRPATIGVTFLIVLPAIAQRLDDGATRVFLQQETIAQPWIISGIKVDLETRLDLETLYSTIERFRKSHPATQLVSVDSSDGWLHGIAESLLWLSLIKDNAHVHPVYWSMPVLATQTYPNYLNVLDQQIRRSRPLVGEARIGEFRPQRVDGYYLLLAIRTRRGYWYLYAPVETGPNRPRQSTTLVRVALRAARRSRAAGVSPAGSLAEGSETFVPQEIQGIGGIRRENRDVYLWPRDMDVPDRLPESLQAIGGQLTVHENSVRVSTSGWVVDGNARAGYTYLVETANARRRTGDTFVARGELYQGGLTFGLQQADRWIAYVNVTRPGRFVVVLTIPSDGTYSVVLANCLNVSWVDAVTKPRRWWRGDLLRNKFLVTSLGWSRNQQDG